MGELGTFRTAAGELVRCRLDGRGRLVVERDSPVGPERLDPSVLTGAVQLSADPDWLAEPGRGPFAALMLPTD